MELGRIKGYMEDYLQQKGLPLRKAFRCLSPEHEDKHPSMRYNARANNVHCFACGATYDLLDLVGVDYGLDSFGERVQKACDIFGLPPIRLEYRRETESGRFPDPSPPPEVNDRTAELEDLRRQSSSELSYFQGRGITSESCEKYGLFLHGGRAYFPVTEGGRCTGWCARVMDDGELPRYKNSSGSLGLWNGDYLASEGKGRRLFVTEGIIDAICLEQMGEKAVALCGSQNTGKLLRWCEWNLTAANGWRFVACGDPDAAGEKMNAALSEGLAKLGLECVRLPLEAETGDIGSLYLSHRDTLSQIIAESLEDKPDGDYASTSAAAGLERFFEEARRRAEQGAIPTGFEGLDRLLDGGLYPGLYVLGAISSLGKTSLVLQMADFIAKNKSDVLFFSLEQSQFELMAKSMSRISAQLDGEGQNQAFTVRQLLSGRPTDNLYLTRLLDGAKEVYARVATRLYIREGFADIGTEDIRRKVREHQAQRGRAPVVIVDYLQILRPADPRGTDKQNTDRAVVELKRISRDFDIPVLAVSSFNRENYRAAVSMEAFKESGAVEYSADVLLGLQLLGAGEKDFDVNKAKSREPRQIELVILKNRNGLPYTRLPMEYRARFNLFGEVRGTSYSRQGARKEAVGVR